jgi:hypothetical protein
MGDREQEAAPFPAEMRMRAEQLPVITRLLPPLSVYGT